MGAGMLGSGVGVGVGGEAQKLGTRGRGTMHWSWLIGAMTQLATE